ncbi:MAG: PucR family transcriptional regulator [Pseudomonadota bacterium]
MTTVITRYFESADQADAFRTELIKRQRVPANIITLYDDAGGLADTLTKSGVNSSAAAAYEQVASSGGVVAMVKAGYKPLGVAKIVRTAADDFGASPMVGEIEEVFVRDPAGARAHKILAGGPLMMTRPLNVPTGNYHMANWPIPLISRRPASDLDLAIFPKHARMADFGLPLITRERPSVAPLIEPHQRMASWPIGLLVPGHKYMAKFPFAHLVPGHKRMASFPIGLLVPGHKFFAKFPIDHLTPRKWKHMANWPFPHLINGKRGNNSLVPGHRFMAKFPFAHLVPGHKRMASFPIGLLVPGQRFMAKFPFAHLVPGHRRMASWPIGLLVPGHKRMANVFLPLTIRHRKQME